MPRNTNDSNDAPRDLTTKVEKWLQEEGYPLEFTTASSFRAAGFSVLQSEYTQPTARRPRREVDVVADMSRRAEATLRVQFVAECKWSADKPWVFFCAGRGMTTAACVAQSIGSQLGQALLWKEAGNPALERLRLFTSDKHAAFGGRQAFSKAADVVFDALRGVTGNCSALANEFDRDTDLESNSSPLPEHAVVTFPLIVVEGRLFEASAQDRSLQLEEVERTRVHFRGAETSSPIAVVDVVTAHGLDAYVLERAKDTKALLAVMATALTEVHNWAHDPDLKKLQITRGARGVLGLPPLIARLSGIEERRRRLTEAAGRPVGAHQASILEGLLGAVQLAIANDRMVDFGDAPNGGKQNEAAFLAHFPSLAAAVERWERALAKLDGRVDDLRSWIPEQVEQLGLMAPTYLRGSVAECFSNLTVGRARRNELKGPQTIQLRVVQDVVTEAGEREWSAYLHSGEREIKVAQLQQEDRELSEHGMAELNAVVAGMERDLRGCFEAIQRSRVAADVSEEQNAIRALRQPLLDQLVRQRMAPGPVFSERCPYCRAEIGL